MKKITIINKFDNEKNSYSNSIVHYNKKDFLLQVFSKGLSWALEQCKLLPTTKRSPINISYYYPLSRLELI